MASHSGSTITAIDSFTEHGALKLAHMIDDYWTKRGRVVDARVEVAIPNSSIGAPGGFWQVRSDMLNGLPRDVAQAGARGKTHAKSG